MCGIAGVMSRNGEAPSGAILDAFARALAHRGPDGEGKYASGPIAMVQTRLAIIDLLSGDQPLFEPGGAALIANAEIYNYVELRAEMPERTFKTGSDCEPPLHLYRVHGTRFAEHLRGMYAIAIFDPAENRLVLARDPFGIKPLYYTETPDFFAFASEPQALIAAGLIAAEIVPERRDELLQLQFTCGRETIFHGIQRVLPGETLVIRDGKVIERLTQHVLPDGPPTPCDINEALARLDRALEDSVAVHQRADVPYGLFLSGGIDSSAILALMARLNDQPVLAYTAGFSDTAIADEREAARRLAASVGARHVNVDFTEADFWSLLPRIAESMDDPAADYAVLPTWKLAERAAEDVKIVLCGEGGDEMLGGYGRYRSVLRPWWRGGRTIRARGRLEGLGLLRNANAAWRDGVASAESRATRPGRTRLQTAQAVDMTDWLPNDLLTKLDRCLMAHSMEGRTPFLDRRIARELFALPDHLKIHKGYGKWLLRHWLQDALPGADVFARKRGFTVPVGEWIVRQGHRIGPMVAAYPAIDEICRPGQVAPLFQARGKRPRLAAWVLLFYALWHRRHVLGLRPEGDAFDCLAGKH